MKIQPYTYNSSIMLKAEVRREDLTDPARRCAPEVIATLPPVR